jgi:hypothetical protein
MDGQGRCLARVREGNFTHECHRRENHRGAHRSSGWTEMAHQGEQTWGATHTQVWITYRWFSPR